MGVCDTASSRIRHRQGRQESVGKNFPALPHGLVRLRAWQRYWDAWYGHLSQDAVRCCPGTQACRSGSPNAMGFRHLGVGARFRVLVTVGSSWLRACRGRRVVPDDGRFHGPAGCFPGDSFRCLRWSGWRVGEGDDDRGDPGGGIRAAGTGEGAGAFSLADAVPVPVDDRAVSGEFPGQCRAAGLPGADGGGDGAEGAGVGDLPCLDGHPGAAPFPGGTAATAAARATARASSVAAAQAACSWRIRAGTGSGASARPTARRRGSRTWLPAARSPIRPTAFSLLSYRVSGASW